MTPHTRNRGNALAELVLLLPLYVLIIFGLIYIGDLTGIRTRLQPAVEQTAARPGTVSEDAMEGQLFSLYPEGDLALEEDPLEPFPPPGELARMIDYLADPPERHWAAGSWVFRDGRLEPVIDTGSSTRPAELSDRHTDDNEPELLEETMRGYMHEASARGRFSYYPGYIHIYPFELFRSGNPHADEELGRRLEARHRAFARGDLERSVEGDGHGHPIEPLVEMMPEGQPMPDYPEFMTTYPRSLWLADEGRPTR
jgi:hypothetical protein